jgi:ElaB/YqjD/DUF883 family membrane-anchored ribosome-binding protein
MATTRERNFQSDLEAIRSDIAALSKNIGKLADKAYKAQGAVTRTVNKAAKASAGIGVKMWGKAADLGHDTTEAVADVAHAGMSNFEKRIMEKPVGSVLLAIGIGIVAGVIGLNLRK